MKKGFTLVEIIVSLMIFSIVAVVALAALVKIIDANKKAQTTHDAVTNLSFTLDSVSRELRSGSFYYCKANATQSPPNPYVSVPNVSDCTGGLSGTTAPNGVMFAFASIRTLTTGPSSPCRLTYAYRIRPDPATSGAWFLEKAEQSDCSVGIISDPGASDDSFSPIVSTSTVSISGFYIRMSYNSTTQPFPLAFLELSGYAGVREQSKEYFAVQSASSPRVP